jgi:uncharacterized phage protein (predicted DNA packaging)
MATVKLTDVKQYLRIDFDDDDTLISGLILASKDFIQVAIDRVIDPSEMKAETNTFYSTWEVPETIHIAQLMLIDHWYNNRGVIGEKTDELPFTVKSLINPHKRTIYK